MKMEECTMLISKKSIFIIIFYIILDIKVSVTLLFYYLYNVDILLILFNLLH